MSEEFKTFGRFDPSGVCTDSVKASYMVQEGFMVKLYRNKAGSATEDELVAIINTATGNAVIDRAVKV